MLPEGIPQRIGGGGPERRVGEKFVGEDLGAGGQPMTGWRHRHQGFGEQRLEVDAVVEEGAAGEGHVHRARGQSGRRDLIGGMAQFHGDSGVVLAEGRQDGLGEGRGRALQRAQPSH
ncbi:hypothetical protein WGA77_07880 [Nocardia seriolae]|nr:hypothetical protein [Nocardia seriolae]WKY51249.1 hypothetical protein Q5P07_30565 [Nocardia seriolae]BEK90600.1 hypothetical protein NSERKGN1266_65510 [Nocardia seriolae]GEM24073.1 hypothetical protein NS2_23120 [Nocardia seriolae NBRC 15557]